MKKKKLFLSIALCAAFFLCISSTATATLTNMWGGDGDRVVYDSLTRLYWYPDLTYFDGKTRSQQEAAIDQLVYAGSSDWRMANFMETTLVKWSLAEMAENFIYWDFGLFPKLVEDPTPGDRTASSPHLAWEVNAQQFFTPTSDPDYKIWGMPTLVFNGRFAGLGLLNDFSNPLYLGYGDDHWMQHNLATPNAHEGYYLTMMFNNDGHPVDDEATDHGFIGGVGAWAVTSSVSEPATMLLFGSGLLILAGLGRRKFKKG